MQIADIRWKNCFPSKNVDAKKAYESLKKLSSKNDGKLTADMVVDAAQSQRHILHPLFEWDDAVAATEHRRNQARCLIRSIEVVYEESPAVQTRVFEIHTKGDGEKKTEYAETIEVLNDPVSRDRLIAEAIKAAMQFRRRFGHLQELEKVVDAIESFIEEVEHEVVEA